MAKEYPLIRIPTQYARMNLFDVLAIFGFFFGILVGIHFGHRYFGIVGAILGAVAGGILGIIIGLLPRHFMQESMFKEMQKSSNEQLKAKIEHPSWSFYNTLALLNLQVRGEDVQPYLPRVLALLESDDPVTRLFWPRCSRTRIHSPRKTKCTISVIILTPPPKIAAPKPPNSAKKCEI